MGAKARQKEKSRKHAVGAFKKQAPGRKNVGTIFKAKKAQKLLRWHAVTARLIDFLATSIPSTEMAIAATLVNKSLVQHAKDFPEPWGDGQTDSLANALSWIAYQMQEVAEKVRGAK